MYGRGSPGHRAAQKKWGVSPKREGKADDAIVGDGEATVSGAILKSAGKNKASVDYEGKRIGSITKSEIGKYRTRNAAGAAIGGYDDAGSAIWEMIHL